MSDPDIAAAAEEPLVDGNVLGDEPEPDDAPESNGPEQDAAVVDPANAELSDELNSIRALGEDR